ncbi:hypothetical protein T05_369 [Trichinella murrelli]|uniref:Uncharacterized protein n=1 Tax=Trichinella murrelli TaxID=144512 RepID=A0A0V0U9X7_9BILA|nr:hypothetical protein T05_369 [Trichinella murrelli]
MENYLKYYSSMAADSDRLKLNIVFCLKNRMAGESDVFMAEYILKQLINVMSLLTLLKGWPIASNSTSADSHGQITKEELEAKLKEYFELLIEETCS